MVSHHPLSFLDFFRSLLCLVVGCPFNPGQALGSLWQPWALEVHRPRKASGAAHLDPYGRRTRALAIQFTNSWLSLLGGFQPFPLVF